jgi:hypothetical protein
MLVELATRLAQFMEVRVVVVLVGLVQMEHLLVVEMAALELQVVLVGHQ